MAPFALLSVSVLLLGCITQEGTPSPSPSAIPTVPSPSLAAPSPSPSPVPSFFPSPSPQPSLVPSPSPSPVAQAPTATITIQNFAFNPPTLEIAAGTTVVWVNNDDAKHNVRSVPSSPVSFISGNLLKGQTYSVTFNHTGAYGYYSGLYRDMIGNVIVR
ncbi:hypothetical protein COT29_02185 [Candidatus Micrarchaeota archaeon CG08_land_8_20_14_0_20_59_11]|nr:MAG: hypothetical protein COT29_02185 [Candidatus Micrarchaeota archaeon CG08_land_8_20_14_0_20_59_11]